MNNILTQNKLVKNLRAYPVLRKRWRGYIRGVRALPEGFTEDKLFHDYLRVRRSNPEKRVSMSEYMIFGFYGLTTAQQKQYLTDVEATLLMRPYNSIAEPYLKSKVTFLKNFTQFVSRGWLYLPESDPEAFDAFVHRYHVIALKPQYSSWGIGFRKLTEAEWDAAPDRQALFDELCAGKYLAEEFVQSDDSLARFHPASLNTLRVITFRRGDRFEVFGAGLRGLHFQQRHQQAKLVRAISGEIFDVAVDLRRGSATYGRWVGVVLSAENRRQLYIPRGFAHGFQVLSEQAVFAYKCGDVYHPEDEGGLRYDDADIGIVWPGQDTPILSEKDQNWPALRALGIEL